MEKKRKRIPGSDHDHKVSVLVSSSTKQKVKKVPGQEQEESELNYLNKPHMLFK